MQKELVKVLEDIKETDIIANILLNMSNRDMMILNSLLEYADSETQSRWLNTYSKLLKV